MRRIALALAILLAAPAWAQARVHTIAPPGNSSVGQYLETVPTGGGGQPSDTVHPGTGVVADRAIGRPGRDGREQRLRRRRDDRAFDPARPRRAGAGRRRRCRAGASHRPSRRAVTRLRRRRRRDFVDVGGLDGRWIVAGRERVQGLDRLDRRRWARAAVADRPDRQRARGRRAGPRAPPAHELSPHAACVFARL